MEQMTHNADGRRQIAILALVVAFAAAWGVSGFGAEPWTDNRQPVTKGLAVWFDASRLVPAYQAVGRTAPAVGAPVVVWPDGSGHRRDVVQTVVKAQPKYQPTGEFHAMRFDGAGTYLHGGRLGANFQEATVFLVTATYSNPASFAGWFALSEFSGNDFETGLNADQGVGSPPSQQIFNVEGVGSSGMQNLLQSPIPYGHVSRMCVTSKPGPGGVTLWVNGNAAGSRDRGGAAPIKMDELIIGARWYTLGGPPEVRGHVEADIAEFLVYDRVLSAEERRSVDQYLQEKYGKTPTLTLPKAGGPGKPLVRVENPPPVQVLVPGFAVQQLPVDLTNINNLLYRPDGKLVALGYDGNVWLLSDSDGDGLEDHAALFWENRGQLRAPIGMDLTPPGFAAGQGVFVASKGKCSLLLDRDRDDRADEEIVVAEGWKEAPHGVDALGVAVDPRDGAVFFGLGTTEYVNPYIVGADGRAAYDLHSERGTVLRIAPDLKSREIFCTGIRFPVGLRFHPDGSLFCTDQEGATWLANGNPFDEFLHLQAGRHYGFPPRHPRHLPQVIDEPSNYDYGPQHQSTCGFCFNHPQRADWKRFGPSEWADDAFVTGYSRGKLYRTEVVRTPQGYIARNSLFACLNMLPADCCLTPDGGLLVCCHSGGPDWGSGPTGRGRVFKISYVEVDHPQPVLAWAATPREVRVEFDRPVPPELLRDAVAKSELIAGEYVRAGDRFESLAPGYTVVQMQQRVPRLEVPILSAQLTADRRTLVLATGPLPGNLHFALTLPGPGRESISTRLANALPQLPQIDLDFDLAGVEATWQPREDAQGRASGAPSASPWQGWLPTMNLAAAEHWTRGSATHEKLWSAMREPGTLAITAQINPVDLLRPAVQPGARIDYEWPTEAATLVVSGARATVAELRDKSASGPVLATSPGQGELRIPSQSGHGTVLKLEFPPATWATLAKLNLSFNTVEDARLRPFSPQRQFLPWASRETQSVTPTMASRPAELEGGRWARGYRLFHETQRGCAKCHSVTGRGARIGPDLSNLIHRDYASVYRDITQPNFAINPDYLTSILSLHDGRVVTGVVRTQAKQLHVGDAQGKVMIIDPADVEEARFSSTSIMPEGLLKQFTAEEIRDLLTYLLTPAPSMPREDPGVPRPAPRTVAEVEAVLAGSAAAPSNALRRPLKIGLIAGPKDHGPGEHDYPAWQAAWRELLELDDRVQTFTAMDWPTAEQLEAADVLVFYQRGDWTPVRAAAIDAFLARGGGLVYIHWAVDGQQDSPGFAKRIALAWGAGAKFRHGPLSIDFPQGDVHPITRGLKTTKFVDESYWGLTGMLAQDRILGTGREDDQPQPLFWSLEPGKGRVFVSIPGHYSWSFDDPLFRLLLLRGIGWVAHDSVDRFNDLVWPGADWTR